MEDIVQGTLFGVKGHDLSGNVTQMFLDWVDFLTDFHEAVDCLDTTHS